MTHFSKKQYNTAYIKIAVFNLRVFRQDFSENVLSQEDMLQAIAKTGRHVLDETKVCISLVCMSTARVGAPALAGIFGAGLSLLQYS